MTFVIAVRRQMMHTFIGINAPWVELGEQTPDGNWEIRLNVPQEFKLFVDRAREDEVFHDLMTRFQECELDLLELMCKRFAHVSIPAVIFSEN
jgi:hypothetical protein